jgi:hypothetical protein
MQEATAPRRTCLFCNATGLTLEDVWPTWLVKLLPIGEYDIARGVEIGDSHERQRWKQKKLELKARFVCAKCNNGWMSRVEEATIPVLRPLISNPLATCKISRHDQRILSTWIMLRCMIFDNTQTPVHYYSHEQRKALYQDPTTPLENTHVWLALLPPRKPSVGGNIYTRITEDKTFRFTVFNCIVGEMTFQVFSWHGTAPLGFIKDRDTGKVINLKRLSDPAWTELILKLWPRGLRPFNWPLGKRLSKRGTNLLWHRFEF